MSGIIKCSLQWQTFCFPSLLKPQVHAFEVHQFRKKGLEEIRRCLLISNQLQLVKLEGTFIKTIVAKVISYVRANYILSILVRGLELIDIHKKKYTISGLRPWSIESMQSMQRDLHAIPSQLLQLSYQLSLETYTRFQKF